MKLALLGHPLEHSFSSEYFANKFITLSQNHSYENLDLDSLEHIRTVVEEKKLDGFNVTIPYKEKIISHLDKISPDAAAINAVNTIKITQGRWIGYNTDHLGFRDCISSLLHADIKALIFGSGGSSKAVQFALSRLGVHSTIVSRSVPHLTYKELTNEQILSHQLLINTTPLGQHPKTDACVDIAYEAISNQHIVVDLIYNPDQTLFLQQAQARGARVLNGKSMLISQAEYAWEIWQA